MLWVGVKCDLEVTRAREALRPDRVAGMAESQLAVVREGVVYDLIVDTPPFFFGIVRCEDPYPGFASRLRDGPSHRLDVGG